MRAVDLSREELLKESRKIYRNISKRLKRIREMENPPEYALNAFRELQEKYPRDTSKLTNKELREYYRQLRNIDALKSSSMKGVQEYQKNWRPIYEFLKTLSPNLKDKFWEIYGKVYEDTGMAKLYKYDVFENIALRMGEGEADYEIINTITKLYDKLKKSKGNLSDEEFKIRFAEELNELL